MNAALAEAWLALVGTLRLARGDASGLACFDPSIEGFWRSFRASVLCYPFYLVILSFPIVIGDGPVEEIDATRFFAVETVHFVIAWVAFPLVVLPIVDWMRRGNRFLGFMVVYNWCQVLQTVAFAAVALLGGRDLVSVDVMLVIDLIVGIAALVYEWYIARVALAVSGGHATLIIVAEIVLAVVLTHVSRALY